VGDLVITIVMTRTRVHTLHEALVYGKGTERPFLCPAHGDSRPSASLNVVKGVWYCYTCHAHGGLSGEDALVEPDYRIMKRWLEERLEEGHVYPEAWLSRWDAGGVHPYWQQRVGDRAARHYRLGYDPELDAATYPLRDPTGAVLGVVRRALGDDGPRYRYPPGVDIGRLLFNYSPVGRPAVVLTEGALDAIACWNVGVEAFAIYGSRLSEDQIRLIDRIDPEWVYTCYDNDDAGWQAHLDTERAFRHRLVDRIRWPRSWGKDIDEVGETRRRKLLSVISDGVQSQACESNRTSQTISSSSTSPAGRLVIRSSGTWTSSGND
jgi:DNA primase